MYVHLKIITVIILIFNFFQPATYIFFKNLIQNALHLQFDCSNEVYLFMEDGTEIDDDGYFDSLENQAFLLASNSEKFLPALLHNPDPESVEEKKYLDRLLYSLRNENGEDVLVQQIQEFILHQDAIQKWKEMSNYVDEKNNQNSINKSIFSKKSDDPDWFADLSTNAQTKEDFLFKGCQSRIRGYLTKAESNLKSAELSEKNEKLLKDILIDLKALLKHNQFNGHYFNRASDKSDKICDQTGKFLCEGRFDQKICHYQASMSVESSGDNEMSSWNHHINPYESSESRIMFSTWNLDHV